VDECKWDTGEEIYNIKLSSTTGSTAQVEDKARVIVSAVGGFLDPQLAPELPGRDVFEGAMWHSGRWNHDISLSGKKVAVIGNGCSAVQFIPIISKDESTEIVNFCRTPHWLVPLVLTCSPIFLNNLSWCFLL
jgi:cation diffusion facilitator CzcD-associated flavoprotein CzcO